MAAVTTAAAERQVLASHLRDKYYNPHIAGELALSSCMISHKK
jgi:hypothetical protein